MKNLMLVTRSFSSRQFRRTVLALGLCAAAFGSLAVSTPAQAAPADFIGLWVNMNNTSPDLTRMIISGSPGSLGVHVYGACSPTPCDWGIAALTTYGNNVSDPNHKYGTAAYNQGFAQRLLTFELEDADTMSVDTYSRFTDGSGRQDYHTREIFRKIRIIIDPIPGLGHFPF